MLRIKDDYFRNIIESINNRTLNFDAEGGCACGRVEVKLSDHLYLSVYRSCRKSNTTPNDKLWHIEGVEFFKKPFDEFEDEYPEEVKMKLDKEQEYILIDALKIVTEEDWGEENR
ncbi:hypothetical protein [Paenibacillus xylanexedens]|uniref:hypothetical protein n=1 Tax=Paenibacillus xylanexedens TaxID=528191 RepID=UPI00119E284F|nr:hypothetical protein [Paenibacillus xylanexedens]